MATMTQPSSITSLLANQPMLAWFFRRGYLQGVFWITLVNLISSLNDVFMVQLGERLHFLEITFFRGFFAMLVLLPVIRMKGTSILQTNRAGLHVVRILLGFIAVCLWCYCVSVAVVPLALVSTIAQTVPLFLLPLSILLLRERVNWQRSVATIAGFCGILVIVFSKEDSLLQISDATTLWTTNYGVLLLLLAAFLFAISDVINKVMVSTESSIAMLFYFSLGVSLLGFIPAIQVWQMPELREVFYLFCLGFGGNMILFCILKAFAAADVTSLAPYRYLEILFAAIFGYLLFGQSIGLNTMAGAAIIIPSTFMLAYYETRNEMKDSKEA